MPDRKVFTAQTNLLLSSEINTGWRRGPFQRELYQGFVGETRKLRFSPCFHEMRSCNIFNFFFLSYTNNETLSYTNNE